MRFLAVIIAVVSCFLCSSCAPSLKGSTMKIVSIHRGDIQILEKKENYQLIKVMIPHRLDKVCIVKDGSIIEEFFTYNTDDALQIFRSITSK